MSFESLRFRVRANLERCPYQNLGSLSAQQAAQRGHLHSISSVPNASSPRSPVTNTIVAFQNVSPPARPSRVRNKHRHAPLLGSFSARWHFNTSIIALWDFQGSTIIRVRPFHLISAPPLGTLKTTFRVKTFLSWSACRSNVKQNAFCIP